MKATLKYGLWVVAILLIYLVYDSIDSKIAFQKATEHRNSIVIERLKDIRVAQIAFKSANEIYAKNFNELLVFVKNDSFSVIKALGSVPDTLSEEEAVQMGLVTRDTSNVSVKDSIYSPRYLKGHVKPFYIDSLPYIPFGSNEEVFVFESGEKKISQMMVQVFRVFASYGIIYSGLDTKNEDIDIEDGLQVGSMDAPSTSGNWGE
jgi:hypothetical protein